MFETPFPDISDTRDKHAAAIPHQIHQQTPPASAVVKVDLLALALSRFGEWRAGAAALVERYRAVAFDLSTPKGYAELTKAIAEVRAPRFAAQNVSKASKSELASISKAIGAEEAAVAAYLADTEARLVKLRDDHDAKVAAEKAEAARILAERQAKQVSDVAGIRNYLIRAQSSRDMTAERVANGIKFLECMTFPADEWLDPVAGANAQCETLEGMRVLHSTLLAREEEVARLEAQRLENERAAAENARVAAELKRQADELAAARAESERLEQLAAENRARQAEIERVLAIPLPLTIPEESTEGQDSQQVLKAEGASPDATDRDAPADASPRVGAMGAGQAADAAPAAVIVPTMTLGTVNERLNGPTVSLAFMSRLGFEPVSTHKAAKLYAVTDWPAMVAAMVKHLQAL